jgi:hypothetical protein
MTLIPSSFVLTHFNLIVIILKAIFIFIIIIIIIIKEHTSTRQIMMINIRLIIYHDNFNKNKE